MSSPINIRNITIIAHVDHGKTTLVDALLKQSNTFSERDDPGELIMDSNPLEREKGITILAKNASITYRGIKINIIDTPGHAAFTAMRARGAKAPDIVVIVVAADDGLMPQTEEAINHAKASGAPIIIAVNKIDKEQADPDRVRNEMATKDCLLYTSDAADE